MRRATRWASAVNCHELVDDVIATLRCNPDEEREAGRSVVLLREALTIISTSPTIARDARRRGQAAPENGLAPLLAPRAVMI